MLIGKYRFHCVFNNKAVVPEYKGSTFRGSFGHALKYVSCAVMKVDCYSCIVADRCVYAKAIEPLNSKKPISGHPYIIEPPLSQQREYQKGERFDFNLLLLGNINEYFPFFAFAVERMGETGVGRKIDGIRGNFEIKNIFSGGRSIYDQKTKKLNNSYQPEYLLLSEMPGKDSGELAVEFMTPFRFKKGNTISTTLSFEDFIRSILRRISSVMESYGHGEPHIDYRGLIQRAGEVSTIDENLFWKSWPRYSNRQSAITPLAGIMGKITFTGQIGEFIPLLELARTLHVGKQSTFGLGWFEYDWKPTSC